MRVLVGITGGVAAYKAAELLRELSEMGHEIRVVPTQNALRFIGAATLEALSHNPVHSELYSDVSEVLHIELARWAQAVLVAPATASFLARSASGIADDLLGNILLATLAPIVVAPAMHTEMWNNAATKSNVQLLRDRGFTVVEPGVGRLTGSDTGVGRLPDTKIIVSALREVFAPQDLLGKSVLVIAGGTREPIDPVRFIGNRSSGKQGIALVEEAVSRGAAVTLIAANFDYYNREVAQTNVSTTSELESELAKVSNDFDFIVMPAAVSDFHVKDSAEMKIKRTASTEFSLSLRPNRDLITGLAQKLPKTSKLVGFAAETVPGEELLVLARAKRKAKGLSMIVANDVSGNQGFDSEDNQVTIISDAAEVSFAGTKREIAATIFDLLLNDK